MSKSVVFKIILAGVFFVALVVSSYSQSTSQNYPTPATANEITRAINIVRVCSPTTGAPAGASPRGVEAVREGA